jgi:DNA adenine methylase
VGGELNYPRFQTSITDGGHGNRLIGAIQTLHERLNPIYERLRTVLIENLDWQDCIDRYDRPTTVMYIDPPYPENGVNYVHNMRDWESHQHLAARLAQTKCKWIISSYDLPQIRALFPNCTYIPIQAASGMNTDKSKSERVINRELLILNFPAVALKETDTQPLQARFPEVDTVD